MGFRIIVIIIVIIFYKIKIVDIDLYFVVFVLEGSQISKRMKYYIFLEIIKIVNQCLIVDRKSERKIRNYLGVEIQKLESERKIVVL